MLNTNAHRSFRERDTYFWIEIHGRNLTQKPFYFRIIYRPFESNNKTFKNSFWVSFAVSFFQSLCLHISASYATIALPSYSSPPSLSLWISKSPTAHCRYCVCVCMWATTVAIRRSECFNICECKSYSIACSFLSYSILPFLHDPVGILHSPLLCLIPFRRREEAFAIECEHLLSFNTFTHTFIFCNGIKSNRRKRKSFF